MKDAALQLIELGRPLIVAGLVMMTGLLARRHFEGESMDLTMDTSREELIAIAFGQFAVVVGMTMIMIGGLATSVLYLIR
jgi:hypothetical protein